MILRGCRDREKWKLHATSAAGVRPSARYENNAMSRRLHRRKGNQADRTEGQRESEASLEGLDRPSASTPLDIERGTPKRGQRIRRNRVWTEDEETQLAVLLLRHGPAWNRVAAGLRGRPANAVRCKVRNDICVVQTSYRNKRREYGRLLFRVAYRMEERGARLEQLGPADFTAELSPTDHPRIYAAYHSFGAGTEEPSQLAKEDAEAGRPASPSAWWPDCTDYLPIMQSIVVGHPDTTERSCDEDAYNYMLFAGGWGSSQWAAGISQQSEFSDTFI